MQLEVLDVYQCTGFALMHQHIFMDPKEILDSAGYSRWHLMQLDVPQCILMYLLVA